MWSFKGIWCNRSWYTIEKTEQLWHSWISEWVVKKLSFGETAICGNWWGKSQMASIQIGVPQGYIFGPLLYFIYVNDICNFCQGNILSFADDTTLYTSYSNRDELYANANEQTNDLYQWFCSNRLSLNAKKKQVHCIETKTYGRWYFYHLIHIGNTVLERIGNDCNEQSTKFLGMHIDENLTWKKHISEVTKKVSRALFSIKQVKHVLPLDSLRTLYFALIHQHLCYGILKLNDLFDYQSLLFISDYMSNHLPDSFNGCFPTNRDMHSRTTRQSRLLHMPTYSSKYAQRQPLFFLPKLWNKWNTLLPDNTSRYRTKRIIRLMPKGINILGS